MPGVLADLQVSPAVVGHGPGEAIGLRRAHVVEVRLLEVEGEHPFRREQTADAANARRRSSSASRY
jgi:hypothetical protein